MPMLWRRWSIHLEPVEEVGIQRQTPQRRGGARRREERRGKVEIELHHDVVVEEDLVEVEEAELGLRLRAAVLGAAGWGVWHLVELGPAREVGARVHGLSGEHRLIEFGGKVRKW